MKIFNFLIPNQLATMKNLQFSTPNSCDFVYFRPPPPIFSMMMMKKKFSSLIFNGYSDKRKFRNLPSTLFFLHFPSSIHLLLLFSSVSKRGTRKKLKLFNFVESAWRNRMEKFSSLFFLFSLTSSMSIRRKWDIFETISVYRKEILKITLELIFNAF